jgi:hypothetical protein
MKAIIYKADDTFETWAKTGYLFENGFFISKYRWLNTDTYYCECFPEGAIPEKIGWGKGVFRAISNYQFFIKRGEVDMDFENLIAVCKNLSHINENLSGVNLNAVKTTNSSSTTETN